MKSNPYSVRITALKRHRSLQLLTPLNQLISDIAAFTLKPLFLVGGTITAISFILTVRIIHFTRHDHRVYRIDGVRWKKGLPVSAMVSSVVTDPGPVLLAVIDTFRFREEHTVLLLVCFIRLASSVVATTIVYFDRTWNPSLFRILRA